MSDRVEFDITCPNNHSQAIDFTREEFEDALASGALVFHCNTCEANWTPSKEDIGRFRKEMAKASG